MQYDQPASKETITKTIAAAQARGINVQFVENKEQALEQVKKLLPDGAQLTTGASKSLEQIGFVDLLKSKNHPWKNLKDAIVAETDPVKQAALRKQSISADYFLGSVHALVEDGRVLVASATGSQIPAYAFSSDNVIWVVGAQKIVPTLDEAFKRLREYVFPLEDARMKSVGYPGSNIGSIWIFEKLAMPNRKINMILVNEALGF